MGKPYLRILSVQKNFRNSYWKGSNWYFYFWSFWPELADSRTPLHMDRGLDHFFPNSIPLDLAKHGFSIIWRSSKNMNFPKIWRLWLKNCARHAHFNFELLKGVAVLFFEVYPWNFDQLWIFYRQKNDVLFIFLYLQQKSWNLRKTPFSSLE